MGEVYTAECRADLGDARCRVAIEPSVIARGTPYPLGAVVRVPLGAAGTRADDQGAVWECTTAGTTAGTQPGGYSTVTAGTAVTDGTAVFTSRDAWTVYGEVGAAAAASRMAFTVAPGFLTQARHTGTFFDAGVVVFETGANAGAVREVQGYDAGTRTITLFAPMPFPVAPGDGFRIQPGCDKAWATCRAKFANRLNFRGEPQVPGADAMLQVGLP